MERNFEQDEELKLALKTVETEKQIVLELMERVGEFEKRKMGISVYIHEHKILRLILKWVYPTLFQYIA